LAFEALPRSLKALPHRVLYKPVLFAAMLKHHGQLGPAEIPAKRDWTYRHVMWLAHSKGVPLDMPAVHPFNPMSLLRLAVATDAQGEPNRYVCETLFRHVWTGGADAANVERLQAIEPLTLVDEQRLTPAPLGGTQVQRGQRVAVGGAKHRRSPRRRARMRPHWRRRLEQHTDAVVPTRCRGPSGTQFSFRSIRPDAQRKSSRAGGRQGSSVSM
jgi:2-hydroxychromene-2-carboxylate isomerase